MARASITINLSYRKQSSSLLSVQVRRPMRCRVVPVYILIQLGLHISAFFLVLPRCNLTIKSAKDNFTGNRKFDFLLKEVNIWKMHVFSLLSFVSRSLFFFFSNLTAMFYSISLLVVLVYLFMLFNINSS